ncbi:response regulator transcription factor [Gluconacetobacter sacchari]|uniref:Response regulator transcription factor n=2 Tax=Gluconacetobacter sacchari TaxID=92759 RepID=A0A7W4IDW2_9PROT|nr:response regulator transcription factor [Gluconacetobacter sacchari]MBB2160972.1 response regulator transcription factor [Gluconacetobacter sacchari]GBQ24460.1 two component response regulator CtrA [Gluconacetobacter sacchari DSM 12717]
MRVLLVEGDGSAARGTSNTLRSIGYLFDHALTGHEAVEMLRRYDYDLALLEMSLPDIDGYEVLRTVRAARLHTPIVAMSSMGGAHAKVRAFSAGADDYITRPYDTPELAARIQAIVRRSKGYSQPVLQAGLVRLSLDSREVTVKDRLVHLTGKEYMILELLMLRRGTVLSKFAFLDHLYGGMDEPEMKIIDVFICKLRKKLQQAGAKDVITTVWGQGYMMREDAEEGVPFSVPTRSSDDLPTLAVI